MAIFRFLARNETVLANFTIAVTFFVTFLCGRQKSKTSHYSLIHKRLKREKNNYYPTLSTSVTSLCGGRERPGVSQGHLKTLKQKTGNRKLKTVILQNIQRSITINNPRQFKRKSPLFAAAESIQRVGN